MARKDKKLVYRIAKNRKMLPVFGNAHIAKELLGENSKQSQGMKVYLSAYSSQRSSNRN